MTQTSKRPVLPLILAVSFAMAGAAAAETTLPPILSLPESSEAALPGDADGDRHGIIVRRGSGFPEPVVVATPEPVEGAPAETETRRIIVRRSNRRGY